MTHDRLPPKLEQLEQELATRPRPDPPVELRGRALGHLRARPPGNGSPGNGSRGRLTFAAALALVVLVWLNLSISASNATDYNFRLGADHQSVSTTAAQIRRLLPELTQREATRQAILLEAGSRLAPCPDVSGGGNAKRHAELLNTFLP